MSDFKIGDKVKLDNSDYWCSDCRGREGVIISRDKNWYSINVNSIDGSFQIQSVNLGNLSHMTKLNDDKSTKDISQFTIDELRKEIDSREEQINDKINIITNELRYGDRLTLEQLEKIAEILNISID